MSASSPVRCFSGYAAADKFGELNAKHTRPVRRFDDVIDQVYAMNEIVYRSRGAAVDDWPGRNLKVLQQANAREENP